MIGIFRGEISLLVTGDAIGRQKRKVALLLVLMAALAVHQSMSPHQRETRVGVNFFHIEILPALKRMAALTVVSHFGLMDVLMATAAVGGFFGKIFDVVTRFAGGLLMTI